MTKSAWNAWECQRNPSIKSLMLAGAALIMLASVQPAGADDTPPKPSSSSVQDAPSPMEAARRAAEQRNADLEKLKQEQERRAARLRPPQPPAPPAPPAPPPAKGAWDTFCDFIKSCLGMDDEAEKRRFREALDRAVEELRREREQQAGGDKPATGSAEAPPKPQQDAPARQAETPKAVPQKSAHTQPRSTSNKAAPNPKSAMRTAAPGAGTKAARHTGPRTAQRAMAHPRNARAMRHNAGRYASAHRIQPSRVAYRSPAAHGLARRSFAPAHHGMRPNMRVMQPRMAMGPRMGASMMWPRMMMGPRMAGPAFGRSMGFGGRGMAFGGRGMSFGGRGMGGFGRF